MNRVFLDTVGLLALWDESDQWHNAADAAMQGLLASPSRFLTTTFVLLECGNSAARTPYRAAVRDLWDELAHHGNLVVPTSEDLRMAWDAYTRGEAAQAGIVDHVSFVVMRRLGITQAFTNDKHFIAAGFEALF